MDWKDTQIQPWPVWLTWLEHRPITNSCGFDSWSGLQVWSLVWTDMGSNQSMFLSHIEVSLSHWGFSLPSSLSSSLPYSLSKSSEEKNVLQWGFKKRFKKHMHRFKKDCERQILYDFTYMRSVQKVSSNVMWKIETFIEEDTRNKKHCTKDNDASVPCKVGTLGSHTVLPIATSYPITFSWISLTVWNLFPFKGDFSSGKSQKSQGAKSCL